MWIYAKFIDDNVAISRMPMTSELDQVVETFNAVVVLVDEFELAYPLEELKKKGVEVLHSPVRDFSAPSLKQLLGILRWIEVKVAEGKRVLIHCAGGCGRSGTVAVAWLMYSRGLSFMEALKEVRKKRPCAVETAEQIKVLRKFEKY
ncbi:protein-tyrosine phosphatase family protein [Thermococcus sp.]